MALNYSGKIRVNALAPGFFLGEQTRFLLTDKVTGELTPRGRKVIEHTPMGRFGGTLKDMPVYQLGATAIRAALARAGVPADAVDEVIYGNCRQAGNGVNPARSASRGSPGHGLPNPAFLVRAMVFRAVRRATI